MSSQDPQALAELVQDAMHLAGVRAVLLQGWGGLAAAARIPGVHVGRSIPHDWRFPRMSTVVHHGGAAFREGVPALVVPFIMDQPFWSARTATLGVSPLPFRASD
jgi:sterol 3beta-glucosyltransferase